MNITSLHITETYPPTVNGVVRLCQSPHERCHRLLLARSRQANEPNRSGWPLPGYAGPLLLVAQAAKAQGQRLRSFSRLVQTSRKQGVAASIEQLLRIREA